VTSTVKLGKKKKSMAMKIHAVCLIASNTRLKLRAKGGQLVHFFSSLQ